MSHTIQVRIDDETKRDAEVLFTSLGLDINKAIRLFLAKSIQVRGIPFSLTNPQFKKKRR